MCTVTDNWCSTSDIEGIGMVTQRWIAPKNYYFECSVADAFGLYAYVRFSGPMPALRKLISSTVLRSSIKRLILALSIDSLKSAHEKKGRGELVGIIIRTPVARFLLTSLEVLLVDGQIHWIDLDRRYVEKIAHGLVAKQKHLADGEQIVGAPVRHDGRREVVGEGEREPGHHTHAVLDHHVLVGIHT